MLIFLLPFNFQYVNISASHHFFLCKFQFFPFADTSFTCRLQAWLFCLHFSNRRLSISDVCLEKPIHARDGSDFVSHILVPFHNSRCFYWSLYPQRLFVIRVNFWNNFKMRMNVCKTFYIFIKIFSFFIFRRDNNVLRE